MTNTTRNIAGGFRELGHSLFALLDERASARPAAPLSIALGSARPREGRTTMAEGLATTAATLSDLRILLVDAHFGSPALTKKLGLSNQSGLSNFMYGETEALSPTTSDIANLQIIGAGTIPRPSALYRAGRMKRFLALAGELADCVIIDAPSIDDDATPILDAADRILVVVDSSRTPAAEARTAISSLPSGKAWGVVLNKNPLHGASKRNAGY